jgi:hypothetical protein
MEELKKASGPTKRVKLTRSILLNREHAEEGEVRDLPERVANDLIFADSAVPCDAPMTKREPAPPKEETRKIKVTRAILLQREHVAAGEIREVPLSTAYSLIADKSAAPHGWRVGPQDSGAHRDPE